jgi:hypothetical protein
MYFPVLHSGQYDLLALRDAAADIRTSGKVIPVIIPVARNGAGLATLLRRYNRSEQPFCFVVNPICCQGTMTQTGVNAMIDEVLRANRIYHPTLMVNASTTAEEIETFRARFPENDIAFFHLDELVNPAAVNAARAHGRWHLIEPQRRAYVRMFPSTTRVLVEDPFNKVNNADYPADESYSDTFAEYINEGFAGFGDYQAIGRQYSPGGFTPRAVALHLTYLAENGAVRVRHFVSGPVVAAPEVPGRFLEALALLAAWAEDEGEKLGFSTAVKDFAKIHRAGEYPGLAIPKKLAIRHHLELVMSLL